MCPQATCTNTPPELIVYGGSFDPPHNGHVQMIEDVLGRFPEAQIIVVPSYAPTIAGQGSKAVVAPFSTRLAMAKLAFAAIAPRRVTISSVEEELPTPSYTLRTLQILRTNNGGKRIALLLGQDQFEALPRWHEPKAILSMADVIVVPREHQSPDQESLADVAAKVGNSLSLGLQWNSGQNLATTTDGHQIFLLPRPVCPATSSAIRQKLLASEPVTPGWLPDAVQSYIEKNQLYRHSEDNS